MVIRWSLKIIIGATASLLSQGANTKTAMSTMMYGNLAINLLM